MQLESLNSPNIPVWILSLLPPKLPGKVTTTFPSNKGHGQNIYIKPLINVPLKSGELVTKFFAIDSSNQFNKGDFISFEWERPGEKSYDRTRQKDGNPKAISLTQISAIDAENMAENFKDDIASDLRYRLNQKEIELEEREGKIDKLIEEKVENRLIEVEKLNNEIRQRETTLEAEKNELYSKADLIEKRKLEIEKLIQSVEPYRLAVPWKTKAETNLSTETETPPEKLTSQWQNALVSSGLILPETLSISYLVSLISAFFSGSLVLLNGPVGVGKTSIVKESAKLLGGNCKVIPVRPAWLDPADLLGFFDPIKEIFRPSPFLNALKNAEDTPERLNLICLDELNLARIENYGADLLSTLEYSCPNYQNRKEIRTKEGLLLYSESIETELWREAKYLNEKSDRSHKEQQRLEQLQSMLDSYRANFCLSSNIAILGTLNSDETTYDLSPKVIDRAYVISYPSADLASTFNTEAVSTDADLQQSSYLSVPTLTNEISLRMKQLSQLKPINQPEGEALIKGLVTSWKKVLQWNKSFSSLGIPLGHRANRDFKVIYAVCNLLGLSSQDCLGYFLFTKLLPRVSFFKGPNTVDQYDQWLSTLRKDFNDLDTKLDDYDPGDILEQIQSQVEDIRRQHVRYWVRT